MPCSSSSAALWLGESKLVANRGEVLRFDLRADPGEKQPLPAGDHPAAAELLEYCRALDRAHASRPVPDAVLSEELSAQLKALGYLREDDEPLRPEPPKPPSRETISADLGRAQRGSCNDLLAKWLARRNI